MTTEPFRTPPDAGGAPAPGTRPSTVVAVLVVVLTHVVLVLGGAVLTGAGLVALGLRHPGFGRSLGLLIPSALNLVLVLALAAAEVVLLRRLFRGAGSARVALTVCLALSGLIALGGVVTLATRGFGLSLAVGTLPVVEVLLCAAGIVLLWLGPTGAWLRVRSVGPARPGL